MADPLRVARHRGSAAVHHHHPDGDQCRVSVASSQPAAKVATMIDGVVGPGFEQVRDVFADVLTRQSGGAAVAAWLDGRWLVDLWGGPGWSRDSIVMPHSVTKPFTAVWALLLVERGRLELDAPVRRYWPEFTAPATIRQVLSHQAGVVTLDVPEPTATFYDWDRLCALLAAQEPVWEPGTAHGESALFYGHLVGELVPRTDGRSLDRLLADECAGRWGWTSRSGWDRPSRSARST
jgi:CubicO group peptidase (beta-lactamase class C family)